MGLRCYSMKKVRFETPLKSAGMHDLECHSPRPFSEKRIVSGAPEFIIPQDYTRIVPFTNDPVLRYENSNSTPYPTTKKSPLSDAQWQPSNDLELSLLDSSNFEPRHPFVIKHDLTQPDRNFGQILAGVKDGSLRTSPRVLCSIENNKKISPPNVLVTNNDFFLRRDQLVKNPLHLQLNHLSFDKENSPAFRKMTMGIPQPESNVQTLTRNENDDCMCHHCIKFTNSKTIHKTNNCINVEATKLCEQNIPNVSHETHYHCPYPLPPSCTHCKCLSTRVCHSEEPNFEEPPNPLNAVDKKAWILEKYEKNKKNDCLEVEPQTNVAKDKREPTVADLFKIIKLQNEQLQLLQEKVDKFINNQHEPVRSVMHHKFIANQVVDEAVKEQHKISIGVMTSFEMVQTSTIINKEIVKQNEAIQCNRSQISIKGVVSKTQPVLNFLDGITPVSKAQTANDVNNSVCDLNVVDVNNSVCDLNVVKRLENRQLDNVNEEKTLNEMSLYNVQVDNATTPLMSPDQSLYLDIRDYSGSECGSVDRSNVGWTYYNKVMTHVNGMLQDSDMPSSASAMYRNTRKNCVQMQVDKTNVSIAKRVTFGDDPLGIQQPLINASTDTSMKMNQLAAKYLRRGTPLSYVPSPKPAPLPNEMSFATRNYMELHKLINGPPLLTNGPAQAEIPRFLDITALKQQPKLL